MPKRTNPHRRLLERQERIRVLAQVFGNAEDAGKLQEGRVRSSLLPRTRLTTYTRPHSKFGDEPPERPVIPLSQRVHRY